MEQKAKRFLVLKNLIYTIIVLICYIIGDTPGLFVIGGVKPVLVIGAIVAIAINEGEFSGAMFGLLGGVLFDGGAFHFFGLASLFFMVLGCACSLTTMYLMQEKIYNAFLLGFGFCSIYYIISHYVIYGLWGYEGASRLIFTKVFPTAFLTGLTAAIMFFVIMKIRVAFEEALK